MIAVCFPTRGVCSPPPPNTPQSAIMLLHDSPAADVIKVTITEKEAGIQIRDMILPDDIQDRACSHPCDRYEVIAIPRDTPDPISLDQAQVSCSLLSLSSV
jgi:hypothetical protein